LSAEFLTVRVAAEVVGGKLDRLREVPSVEPAVCGVV